MTTSAVPDVKPCPFCGSSRVELHTRDRIHSVECGSCNARMPAYPMDTTKEQAVAAWNRRTP